MKRRILSILLVIVMVLGMLPVNVMAAQMLPIIPGIGGEIVLPGTEEQPVTVWFSAVDGSTGEFIVTRHELEVPAGTMAEYGWANAAPGHTIGGFDHGVEEGEVTPMDALLAAHEEYYGEDFNPETMGEYIVGSSSYVTTIFGRYSMGGISFAVNDRLPVGPMSDGYAANEYVLQDGDEVVWYLYGSQNYDDHYSYFVDENGDSVREITVIAGEELTLSVEAFYAMEQMWYNPGQAETPELTILNPDGASIYLAEKDGMGATLGDEAIATTDENGSFSYTFEEAGTYYLSATGTVPFEGMMGASDAPIIMPWVEVEVIAPLAEGDGVLVWNDGNIISIIDQVLDHPGTLVFPYAFPAFEGEDISIYTTSYDYETWTETLYELPVVDGKVTMTDEFEAVMDAGSWGMEYYISTSGHETSDDLWNSDIFDYINIVTMGTDGFNVKYYDSLAGAQKPLTDGTTIVAAYNENGDLVPTTISPSFYWKTADGIETQGGDWPHLVVAASSDESVVKPVDGYNVGLTVVGQGEAEVTLSLRDDFWSGFEPITFTVKVAEGVDAAAIAVIELIKALPSTANVFDEAAIVAAREVYDALTEDQQAQVANYAKLTGLEEALEEMKASFTGLVCSLGYQAENVTSTTLVSKMSGRDEWTGKNIAKSTESVTFKAAVSEDAAKVTVDGIEMVKGEDGLYTVTLTKPTDHEGLTLYKVEAFKEGSEAADETVTAMLFWTGAYTVDSNNYGSGFQPSNTQINLYRGSLEEGITVFNDGYTFNNTGVSDKHVSYKVSNIISERVWIRYNIRSGQYSQSDVQLIDAATGKVVSQRFWSEVSTSPAPYEGPEAGEGIELKVGSNLLLAKMWPVQYQNVSGVGSYTRVTEVPTVMAVYLDRLDDTLSTDTGITSIKVVGDLGGEYTVEQTTKENNGANMKYFETTVAPNETGIKVIYTMPEIVDYYTMYRGVNVGSLIPQEREPVSNTVEDGVRTVVLHYGTYDERHNDFYTEYSGYLQMLTKAEDGICMETYNLDFTRPALPADGVTDSDLKSLTVNGGTMTPAFDPEVTEYAVELGATVKQFKINAIAKFGTKGATVAVDGKFTNQNAGNSNQGNSGTYVATYGMNQVIEVVVTPPEGSALQPKTYTITVTKSEADDGDPLVKGWSAAAGTAYQLLNPDTTGSTPVFYASNVGLTYTDDATGASVSNGGLYMFQNVTAVGIVDGACTALTMTPDIAMSSSVLTFSYTVNGGEKVDVPAGAAAFNIPVPNKGENTIVVTFQNEAGTVVKNHTFKITKQPNATLGGLTSEDAVFVGKFSPTMYRMNMLIEPGTEAISVTAVAAEEGATVDFNGVTGTGSATAEGLVKDTEYTIKVTFEGQSYTYYLVIKERQEISADRVWAVMPAPGQFVNEHSQTTTGVDGAQGWGDGWDTTLYGATPEQAGMSNYARPGYSLGWFGGFITYEFDEPIQNSDKNKYGVDFIVYGNAFVGNSEPAGVMVSQDGETWYTLAGSKHYDSDTVWDYEVTYMNSNPDFDPYISAEGDVTWKDNQGEGGTFASNGYHPQPSYPVADNYLFEGNHAADIYDSEELTLSGTKITGAGQWGYADVHPNAPSDFDKPGNPYVSVSGSASRGDGFDISWAVDENGMPVNLDSVKYVKVYNASREYGVGEISPEITAITRVTGEAESVGTTEAPVITVNGITLELTDGVYTYDVPMSGTVNVTATLDNGSVWINNDSDGSYTEENVTDGRIIRVLAQKDESQPVIYYLTMVRSVIDAEDIAEVEAMIDAIGDVTLAKESQIQAARAAFNAIPASMQYLVSNYAVLTAAEAKLQELKDSISDTPVENTIDVTFRLIGAELADEDVDLRNTKYRPNYVTWVATTAYEMDKGSTIYDLFVKAMADAGLTQVGAENNYVETIYSPSGYELSEFTNGNRSGWMYTINGSHPDRGLRYRMLSDGDEVIWHYVNDYAWEVEDWSAIGGGQWPQESTGENNYWNGWLQAPDYVGGKGGALSASAGNTGGGVIVDNTKADKEAAAKVDSLIAAIGTVTPDSESAIKSARAAYDALTAAQKALVSNYSVLTDAEKAYEDLIANLPEMTFTDVAEEDYYYDAVVWAVENGITVGTGDDTFSPDMVCTRAQMVTFLWRAAGEPKAENTTCVFTDVEADAYYYEALLWAVEKGITLGTGAETFSPDMECTRAQMVTFLNRAAGKPETDNTTCIFTDADAEAYYYEALLWAVEKGITLGTGAETFSPDMVCTRAQMVTFLYRAMAK